MLGNRIRNPRTERQQAGRRVFGLLSGLACGMRAAVAVGLRGAGAALGMSARNLFIRLNRSCVGAEGVDYSHVLVAEGALAGVEFGAVHREGLRLTVSYVGTRPAVSAADGAISCGHGTPCPCSTDYVYLFAYAPEWGEGVLSTPAQRREGVVSLTLPSFWAGSEVQLYGFVWDREAECSPSVWLGQLLVDAGRAGEAPDADGTDAGEGPEETPSEKIAEADFKKSRIFALGNGRQDDGYCPEKYAFVNEESGENSDGGHHAAEQGAYDAAYQCTAGGEAMHEVGVLEVGGPEEEGLQALLGPADDGGVVAEKQAAQHGHQHDAVQITFASFIHNHILHFLTFPNGESPHLLSGGCNKSGRRRTATRGAPAECPRAARDVGGMLPAFSRHPKC